ncbi:MAG: hypothetical protein IOD12_07650 [Silvanigrellales bacterium]|nr:hypothetical protein [Silvanigrellales bacterium]
MAFQATLKSIQFLSFFAVANILGLASVANASNYPPDYVIDSECKVVGPARVCAQNRRYGGWPRFTVSYQGPLQATQWGRISVYVSLNGRQGVFPMANSNFVEMVSVGGLRNVSTCVPAGSPSVGRPYPACTGGGSWNYSLPSQAELDVMFYARDQVGQPNAWDMSFAFVAEDGTWDSANGANYSIRFE